MATKVFIVEDELIHLEALKVTLEETGLQLVGECHNADLAFPLIMNALPDVLLVDIALPGVQNGMTLADRVRRELKVPHIYTTSFTDDDIIRQAVKTNPAGYLRKPVDPVNLKAAVEIALQGHSDDSFGYPERSKAPLSFSTGVISPEMPPPSSQPIFTRVGDKLIRIRTTDLLIIRADGDNYISLVFDKKEISCRTTLKEFCSQLPSSFIQVHRSYYINLDQLDSFNEREQTALLKGHAAPVARNFRRDFLNALRRI